MKDHPKQKSKTIQGHLEEKLREQAKESQDISLYDAYLERFKGTTSDKNAYARFVSEREDVMWKKHLMHILKKHIKNLFWNTKQIHPEAH